MTVTPLSDAQHLPPQVLLERVGGLRSLRWAGAGAHMYAGLIREHANRLEINFREEQNPPASAFEEREQWTIAPDVPELAEHISRLAIQSNRNASDNDDVERYWAENLHAIYVRPSDAELNSHVKG